ncbi:MAG TPA: hypothetical protein VHL80_01230 [Polyangia bacterium]|nr:hypothetical protein [Polyangia bacterium]
MEWTPRHRTTNRTETLVRKLGELAHEIDDSLLQAASIDARCEWNVLCETWPSPADVRSGIVGMSDEELDALIGKVQRFKSILTRMKARDSIKVWGPRPVPRAAAAA